MVATTPIASLVESMLAQGVDHDSIVHAVEAAETSLRRRSPSRTDRGTRLPPNWTAPRSYIDYAAATGMPQPRIALEIEKFRNYWVARTGAGATKRDWEATWRNWILNAMEKRHDAAGRRGTPGATPAARLQQTGANA